MVRSDKDVTDGVVGDNQWRDAGPPQHVATAPTGMTK